MQKFVAAIFFTAVFTPQILFAAAVPANFGFQYDRDGGLYPESTRVSVSARGGTYQHYYNGLEQKINFSVSQKEITAMYNTFRWYFFTSLKTKTEEAYDRGGDSVSLTLGAQTITKSNFGKSYINGTLSRWRYNKITSAINSFTQKKISAHHRPLAIEIETHLTDYRVELAINGRRISNLNAVSLLPGMNELAVALYDDLDLLINGNAFTIEIPETKIVRIQIRDRDISLSPE